VKDLNLSGFATGLPIVGIGTLIWPILTDSGTEVELYIRKAVYVPAFPMNLLSPQHLAQQTKRVHDGFNILATIGIYILLVIQEQ
jgi:hypothetical protein